MGASRDHFDNPGWSVYEYCRRRADDLRFWAAVFLFLIFVVVAVGVSGIV
jgi:hypothetical protein